MSTSPKLESHPMQIFVAVVCALSLMYGDTLAYAAQSQEPQAAAAEEAAPKIPNDQLDALVAPIALYPDPLLSQVLVASTYPLEIIQLQQWLVKHKDLKDKALTDAVMKEDWDPSIQSMAALPDAVKQLAENIKWTTDLGNAFLAQQSDVMDAVQRMRAKAKDAGNLKSNEQMKVETKVIESKTVVIIEQAKPEVVYVPSYNPVVVYGPPVYPYPPIAYPPPGYYAAGAVIGFGVGLAIGAAWGGGGWCCNSGWGSNNNITINNNNNYVKNSNVNGGNRNNVNGGNRNNVNTRPAGGGGNSNWQHNPSHRGGAPYSNKAAATKYGGTSRGDSMSSRQSNARQNQGQQGGRQQAGNTDRGGGDRQQPGASNRADSNAGARQSNTGANRGGAGGGGNNIGNRQVPSGNSSRDTSSFGGSSSKAKAQSSSSRGASSMGSRGGGGGGGGSRGGGGGRRR